MLPICAQILSTPIYATVHLSGLLSLTNLQVFQFPSTCRIGSAASLHALTHLFKIGQKENGRNTCRQLQLLWCIHIMLAAKWLLLEKCTLFTSPKAADRHTDSVEHQLVTAPRKQGKTFASGSQIKVWCLLKKEAFTSLPLFQAFISESS